MFNYWQNKMFEVLCILGLESSELEAVRQRVSCLHHHGTTKESTENRLLDTLVVVLIDVRTCGYVYPEY